MVFCLFVLSVIYSNFNYNLNPLLANYLGVVEQSSGSSQTIVSSHMVVFGHSSHFQFVIHYGAYGIESFFSLVFLLETEKRFNSETNKLYLEF